MQGCSHYRRRCKIVSPCCGEVFWCRHCHNQVHMEDEPVSNFPHHSQAHCRPIVWASMLHLLGCMIHMWFSLPSSPHILADGKCRPAKERTAAARAAPAGGAGRQRHLRLHKKLKDQMTMLLVLSRAERAAAARAGPVCGQEVICAMCLSNRTISESN